MAVPEQTPRNVSIAAPGATVFPYDFKIIASADLLVQVDGADKTLGVDYTVSDVGVDVGGNVTFVVPMVGGETVLRRSDMPYKRDTDYQNLGDLRSDTLNNDQDAPILMIRQLGDGLSRALTAEPNDVAPGYPYDAQGRRIRDVGLATELSDAVPYNQVLTMLQGTVPLVAGLFMSGDFVTNSAPAAGIGIPPFAVALTAGKKYRIHVVGTAQITETGSYGFRFRLYSADGLAGLSGGFAAYRDQATTSMIATNINSANGANVLAAAGFEYSPPAQDEPVPFEVTLVFNCSTSGTLEFRFGNTSGAGAAQLDAATTFVVEELPFI